MVPIFLTSATASGIALLLICAYIMQHYGVLKFKPSMFRSLSTLLATVIIIDLFLLFVEILTIYWPTSAKPGHTIRFDEFLTGDYAAVFLPVLVLGITRSRCSPVARRGTCPPSRSPPRRCTWSRSSSSATSLMAMGFAINPLGQYTPPYVPSLTEVLIALGILALGLLIMTLGGQGAAARGARGGARASGHSRRSLRDAMPLAERASRRGDPQVSATRAGIQVQADAGAPIIVIVVIVVAVVLARWRSLGRPAGRHLDAGVLLALPPA